MLDSIFSLFKKNRKNVIVSVQELTLRTINMRVTNLYKTVCEDTGLKLELYREIFANGEIFLKLEKSVPLPDSKLIELMNNCNVTKWNGFHGKHPKNVLDGTMFTFSATVNNGQNIRADGSENFPKGYSEFVRALNSILAD